MDNWIAWNTNTAESTRQTRAGSVNALRYALQLQSTGRESFKASSASTQSEASDAAGATDAVHLVGRAALHVTACPPCNIALRRRKVTVRLLPGGSVIGAHAYHRRSC